MAKNETQQPEETTPVEESVSLEQTQETTTEEIAPEQPKETQKQSEFLMLKEDAKFFLFGKNCNPLTNEMLEDADIAEFVASKITEEEKSEFFV